MTDSLENLTIRPEEGPHGATSGDLLSTVLAQIRLTGDRVDSQSLARGEDLVLDAGAAYVLVAAEGALHLESDAEATAVIATGDLVLFPHGLGNLRLVASGAPATIIVCRFWFDPHTLQGMISALPERILIRRSEGAGWIEGIVPFMMAETVDTQPGAALMISRIIDLVIIRTLRTWVHQGHASGWLGGLSDPRIGRALKAMHERPIQRWSIDALAEAAGMSRSHFCERFTALVGRSPLRYHNEWRLTLARGMLIRRDARVGEVGLRIGYESEAAFSRAYKALFGHSPRDETSSPAGIGADDRDHHGAG